MHSHPKSTVHALGFGFVCLALTAISGCGSGDSLRLAPVRGTVTYQGKPLERGQVVFNAAKGGCGVPAVGSIAEDGSYEMRVAERKGAPLGECVVTVFSREKPDETRRNVLYVPPLLIPARYTDPKQSPLRFEVKAGSNKFHIVLEGAR